MPGMLLSSKRLSSVKTAEWQMTKPGLASPCIATFGFESLITRARVGNANIRGAMGVATARASDTRPESSL